MWIGAAILGKVGGEMMVTDPFVASMIHTTPAMEYASMIFFVGFVVVTAKIILRRRACRTRAEITDENGGAHQQAKSQVLTAD